MQTYYKKRLYLAVKKKKYLSKNKRRIEFFQTFTSRVNTINTKTILCLS